MTISIPPTDPDIGWTGDTHLDQAKRHYSLEAVIDGIQERSIPEMNDTPVPSEGRLVEIADVQRFVPTDRYTCPQCGGPVLRDNWPPNYSGGTMNRARTEAQGGIKKVLFPCRFAVNVK